MRQQRSVWVVSRSMYEEPRNFLWAGRTGTRLNIGRPQTRWDDGVAYAENLLSTTPTGTAGHALTSSTMYRQARSIVRSAASSLLQTA